MTGVRRGLTWGLVLFGIVALGLLAPAAGVAKKKHKKAVKISTATASGITGAKNTTTTVTATCPGKAKVVGGGFSTSTPQLGGGTTPAPVVYESRRSAANQWRVSALEAHGPGGTVNAYALCEKGAKTPSEVTQSTSLSPLGTDFETNTQATCPGGFKAISGGFLVPPAIGANGGIAIESERVGTSSWQVGAFKNSQSAPPDQMSSFAYCSKEKRKLTTTTNPVGSTPNTTGSLTSPTCPKKTKLAGIGFNSSLSVVPPVSGLVIYQAAPSGRKAAVISGVELGSTPTSLTSTAYCA